MFKAALSGSLKRLVYSQHFFEGDTSWIPDEMYALEYIPVYEKMFSKQHEFVSTNLDKEFINDIPVTLCQKYLKDNPCSDDKHVISSWILGAPNDNSHHQKKILRAEVIMEDVIDLGDSRNFESIQQIMYKIKLVQQAKCYIGSPTSWDVIARWYSKPVIRIWPYE
jgi:hypothetical protein